MTVGNVVAILQTNVKRMLAYSAIAHAGYILIGLVAHNRAGLGAVLFYLIVYTVMNAGAFCIILSLSRKGDFRVNLDDYTGLGHKAPLAAARPLAFSDLSRRVSRSPVVSWVSSIFSARPCSRDTSVSQSSACSIAWFRSSTTFASWYVMYMKDSPAGQPEPDPISLPVLGDYSGRRPGSSLARNLSGAVSQPCDSINPRSKIAFV